jgi:hypothetical protein
MKALLLRLVIIACSVLFSLFLFEGVLQLWAFATGRNAHATLRFDEELGWDATPAFEILPNSALNKDEENSPILFIGDSFTHSRAWPQLVLDKLQRAGKANTAGVSLGVSGFGTYQEYLKLQRFIPRFKPKLVILQLFLWNDLRDNQKFPSIFYNADMRGRPYLVQDNEIWKAMAREARPWYERARLFGLIGTTLEYQIVKRILWRNGIDAVHAEQRPLIMSYGADLSWKPLYRIKDQNGTYVESCWNILRENLRMLRSYLRQNEIELIVAVLDNAFTVDSDVFVAAFRERVSEYDRDLPLRRAREIFAQEQLRGVFLTDALRSLSNVQHGEKVFDGGRGNLSGHLTRAGEEAVSQAIFEEILKGVIPDQ